jgi:signal transduction histidine kinase
MRGSFVRRTAKILTLPAERIAIIAIAGLIVAIFLALSLWFVHERERIRESGFQTGANLAHVLQEQISGSLDAVDFTLERVGDILTFLPDLPVHQPGFRDSLRQNLGRLPLVAALFVVGPDGLLTQFSNDAAEPIDVSDRDYFTAHASDGSPGLFIGRPLRSRATGAWFVGVSRRVNRPDGSFGGVVVAAIEVDRFAAFYRELRLGPQDAIALFSQDGTLLLRLPGTEIDIGRPMRNIRPFDEPVPRGARGAFRSEAAFDKVPRLINYRALDRYPVVVSVALSEDALLAPWRQNAMIAAGVAVALAVCLTVLTLVFVRLRRQVVRAHERRLQAQRLETLGRMTGGIAHDVNNILAVIASGTQLLRRSDIVNKDVLARIVEAVMQGRGLVSQLLSFAKSEALEIGTVSIVDRIEHLKPLMRQAAGSAIEIVIRLPGYLGPCRADAARFDAAILNLVVNARDAMPSGGRITVTGRELPEAERVSGFSVPAGSYVEVCVADTGEGMSPETARKAIEPFFSTKGESGTGLGLSQVYGFMRQIGGDLSIETKLGKGTVVHLIFPRAEGADAASAAPPVAKAPPGPGPRSAASG